MDQLPRLRKSLGKVFGGLHIKHADQEVRGKWKVSRMMMSNYENKIYFYLLCCYVYSLGPTDKHLEKFKESFSSITMEDSDDLRLWKWPETEIPQTFLITRAQHLETSARNTC